MKAVMCLLIAAAASPGWCAEPSAQEVFERRIVPIFRSPKPSSCVQCHLAGVDLKNYILPSQEQTFASLRDQGLVDLNAPEQSRILTLISMGERDVDQAAVLIHKRARQAEYDAFSAWIQACCKDERLRALPVDKSLRAGPARPDEMIRHARKDRVLDSFVRNVWSQRMRCFPCHTPHELSGENPLHKKPLAQSREFRELYGPRMDLFGETPAATLKALIANSQRRSEASREDFPLINVQHPQQSLLVLKPTSKLPPRGEDGKFAAPSSRSPVSHMGGLKMHPDDASYKSFLAWIQDYARIVNDDYRSVAELPRDNWHPTRFVLRLRETPDDWAVGAVVQLFLHRWDTVAEDWRREPFAFTQGTVTPRRFVNGAVSLLPARRNEAGQWDVEEVKFPAEPQAAEKYLLRVYIDRGGRLAEDPAALLLEGAAAGEMVIKGPWEEGFPKAKIVTARDMTRP